MLIGMILHLVGHSVIPHIAILGEMTKTNLAMTATVSRVQSVLAAWTLVIGTAMLVLALAPVITAVNHIYSL